MREVIPNNMFRIITGSNRKDIHFTISIITDL